MELMIMYMDHFFAPSIQLGRFVAENKYHISPNYPAKIEEILRRLVQDKARWHFRRALFLNQLISKNLLPTLTSVKEDKQILESTVKLLQELMTPVECLMPVQTMSKNAESYRIVNELDKSISAAKKLFLDGKSTKALVDLMNSLLQDCKGMSEDDCELINQCLLLVRNLLHVSSVPSVLNANITAGTGNSSAASSLNLKREGEDDEDTNNNGVITEDQIMWNLFAQRFDNVIIQLLTCEQQWPTTQNQKPHVWSITMVQLVSLMYREQQQTTIRKLINEWLEVSLAESSEDDENNPMTSSSSDAISTSDPVSDSSERLSPIEMADDNNDHNGMSSMDTIANSRQSKSEKDDSCKDSGFGRSGSNMDSSQDDSVSEGAQKNKDIAKSPRQGNQLHGHTLQTDQFDRDSVDQDMMAYERISKTRGIKRCHEKSEEDPCILGMDYKNIGKCDMEVGKESGSGSEGGSEGSSPIPELVQESPLSSLGNDHVDDHIDFQKDHQQKLVQQSLLDVNKEQMSSVIDDNVDVKPVIKEDVPVLTKRPSQDQMKLPPKQEESGSSGDSSAKPPPQLPKHHKPMTGQKRSRHVMSQKMLSETQENNESSNSTGSDCDEGPHAKRPHHQKPHKMLSKPRPAKMLQKALQEKSITRHKLLRRKDSGGIKTKALLHHRPTQEDISNLLKEFTIDFMLNGYSNLVQGLRLHVLLPYQIELDKSHLLWLITYFLRFAVELDLEVAQICPLLSVDVVSYLVYEGIVVQEELESLLNAGQNDTLPQARRLHLVVTALREFFIALDLCLKKEHTLIDVKNILRIKEEIGQLVEVRQLFVFLIRMYRPTVLSLNYLQDLITTNHCFLTTQESTSPLHPSVPSFNIVNHVKQFATMDMMKQYGLLLENFNINDEAVNDCIFTMMHHVAGDLRNINVLLQPSILRTFLRIWQEGFELCVDWADLIEYILRKCTRVRTENPDGKESLTFPKPLSEPIAIKLTDYDLDHLCTLYKTSSSEHDLMDKIRDICCDESIEEPIKKEVIQKLLARGFITSSECAKLCQEIKHTGSVATKSAKSEGTKSLEIDGMQISSDDSDDSMDGLPTSFKNLERKEKSSFKSTNSDDFKMPPPKPSKHHKNYDFSNQDIEMNSDDVKILPPELAEDTCDDISKHEQEESDDWNDGQSLTLLIDKLKEEGYSTHIQYLQLQLLEACYSKLKIVGPDIPKPEPLAFHFSLSNQSIPLIPWTSDQEVVFNNAKFSQLLGTLGFHLPSDTGKAFPRIPNFWCPEALFMVAKRLGPINSKEMESLKALKKQTTLIATPSRQESVTVPWKTTGQTRHPRCPL